MGKLRAKAARDLAFAVALSAAVAAIWAGMDASAQAPVYVPAEIPEVTFQAAFAPRVLSWTKPMPVSLAVSWHSPQARGAHPPAPTEFTLDLDRNARVSLGGYPVCRSLWVDNPVTEKEASQPCQSALIGHGRVGVSVLFVEQPEVALSGRLQIYNGPVKDGTKTIYAHVYFGAPVSGAIVLVGRLEKAQEGPFGTEVTFSVPKIAGGAGSITSISATIHKEFAHGGHQISVLTMKCPTGRIDTRFEATSIDGSTEQSNAVRSCVAKSPPPGRS